MQTPLTKNVPAPQGILKFYNYSNKEFVGPAFDHGVIYTVLAGGTLPLKENEAKIMAKYLMEEYLQGDEIGQKSNDVGADIRRDEYIKKALIDIDYVPEPTASVDTDLISAQLDNKKEEEFPDLNEAPTKEGATK